jgi:WD40 repeat protein
MSYSPDGKTLASLDKDGTLNLLDAATGKQIRTFSTGLGGDLSYSQDGKTLTIKGKKNTKKFDVATGKEVQ